VGDTFACAVLAGGISGLDEGAVNLRMQRRGNAALCSD
jgi:hypothetical protein